ncbi:Dicer-like protein 1 [Linnemannia schmuckeri]|uniref:Dicer-like protein 1 n=1 Tax=Linnemannia schmuckeri TaxID=64567 RepID=A0A9P5RW82_9FUNG|nr:Dicer-like protein 1 [Linnemannia schmuckeri]
MDCHIITASYDEVLQYTQRPKERVVYYNGVKVGTGPVPSEDVTREFSRLSFPEQQSCERLVAMLKDDPKLKPAVQWYQVAIAELGPWFGSKSWRHILDTLKEDVQQTDGTRLNERLSLIQSAEQIALSMSRSQLDPNLSQTTQKVQKLVDVLREVGRQPEFCGILFVERRPTAHTMKDFLDECKKFGPEFGLDFIQSAVLTGHGVKGDVKQHHMNIKAQRKILEGFRKGQYNLLVATDVAEEGIDIDRCRLVIRFDVKNTVISHIQSRGRARDPNSEYIIMLPENDGYLEKISGAEADMRRWCGELPQDRVIRLRGPSANGEYDGEDGDDEDANSGLEDMKELAGVETDFRVESTGARVNFYNSVPLLHQYCSSLPADIYTTWKPEFTIANVKGSFHCQLTLPVNALATHFDSGPFSRKSLAKQAVSFQAIKELYRLGGLTDRLLPHRKTAIAKEDLSEEDDDATVQNAPVSLRMYPIHQPTFWENKIKLIPGSDTVSVHATLFSLRQAATIIDEGETQTNFRSLCMLTAAPLPQLDPIELFFDGDPRFVDIVSLNSRVELSVQQVQDLYQYHKLLFAAVFHKSVEVGSLDTGVRHLIAPLLRHQNGSDLHRDFSADQLIDWSEVQLGSSSSSTPASYSLKDADLSWDRLQDMVLLEKGQWGRFYCPIALRTDLTPNSLIPTTTAFPSSISPSSSSSADSAPQIQECDPATVSGTFAQYYMTKRGTDICNLDQPLIEIKKLPRRTDHLQTIKRSAPAEPKSGAAHFLIPELVQKCPLTASTLRSAEWMVSVLVRIDDLLKTIEFLTEFGLQDQIKLPLMLEALTATETSYAMNYQRLELLGDTFLKFMMAVDVFIRYPHLDEGRLTLKRTSRVSNSYLFKRATLLGLDRFLNKLPPVNTHFFVPMPALSPSLSSSSPGDTPPSNGLVVSTGDLTTSATTTQPQPQPPQRKSQLEWQISTKTMADLVESTLGAAYLSQGLDLGLKAAAALLKPLEGIHTWDDFARTFSQTANPRHPPYPLATPFKEDPLLGDLDTVEDSIGYKFLDRRLLVEALTHATAFKPQTPCYQRLEFLGDSILDMLVADYWVQRYPVSGPGVIHEIKAASINNQILGVICVQLGLHQHILHFSSSLATDILRATQQIQDAKEDALSSTGGPGGTTTTTERGEPVGEYWVDFNMTKVLGDVLESVFGAVYVDSGWDYAAIQGLFDRAVLPTLRDHLSTETLTKHPVIELHHRIQGAGCQSFKLKNLAVTQTEEEQAASQSSSSSSTIGSAPVSASSTPFTTPSSPLAPHPLGAIIPPPSATSYSQQQQGQEQSDQVCAVMIHGQPVVTTYHPLIQVARKEAAKRTLALLDSDPEWLTRFCDCPTSSTRPKCIRLEGS